MKNQSQILEQLTEKNLDGELVDSSPIHFSIILETLNMKKAKTKIREVLGDFPEITIEIEKLEDDEGPYIIAEFFVEDNETVPHTYNQYKNNVEYGMEYM